MAIIKIKIKFLLLKLNREKNVFCTNISAHPSIVVFQAAYYTIITKLMCLFVDYN